jgi:hypothetical protein
MKFWEIIADNLSKAGWSWGCVATVDSNGQTIFVADAHRDNGKRFGCVRMVESATHTRALLLAGFIRLLAFRIGGWWKSVCGYMSEQWDKTFVQFVRE